MASQNSTVKRKHYLNSSCHSTKLMDIYTREQTLFCSLYIQSLDLEAWNSAQPACNGGMAKKQTNKLTHHLNDRWLLSDAKGRATEQLSLFSKA